MDYRPSKRFRRQLLGGGAILLLIGWQGIRLGRRLIARRSSATGSPS